MAAGAKRRGRPRTVTDNDVAEMVRLRSNGLTYDQIGSQLGIKASTVGKYLRPVVPAGQRRTTRRLTAAETQFVVDHIRDGWTVPAVAEALGRHPSTISNVTNRFALKYEKGPRGVLAPRIVPNGYEVKIDADTRRAIVSAARRTGTLAATARETGVNERIVERVLLRDAPLVHYAFIRGSLGNPGTVINNWVGDLAKVFKDLSRDTLDTRRGYDDLVEDYGPDKVAEWLDRLERDRQAIRDLSRELRHALERHEQEARP